VLSDPDFYIRLRRTVKKKELEERDSLSTVKRLLRVVTALYGQTRERDINAFSRT